MKKAILISILLVVCLKSFSQSFNERQVKRINRLGIKTNLYDLNQDKIQADFSKILKLNRKRKSNKAFGITMGFVSILTTAVGTALLFSNDKGSPMGYFLGRIIGVSSLGVGVVSGGISIKLFNASKKRKRERDTVINSYQQTDL